jgi:addiction module RelE/StbE family toxin
MKFSITFSKAFQKNYKKLTKQEQDMLKKKIKILSENPMHPSLRTKRVQGTKDVFEFSINMSLRVLWKYEDGRIILLLDVGTHKVFE